MNSSLTMRRVKKDFYFFKYVYENGLSVKEKRRNWDFYGNGLFKVNGFANK